MKRIILMWMMLIAVCSHSLGQIKQAKLSGRLNFLKDGDTIIVRTHKYGIFYNDVSFQQDLILRAKSHCFRFNIKSPQWPQYIDLIFKGKENINLYSYLVSPGDDIYITGKAGKYIISGSSSAGFKIQQKLKLTAEIFQRKIPGFTPETLVKTFLIYDSCANKSLSMLYKAKPLLSPQLFSLLNEDIRSSTEWIKFYTLHSYAFHYIDSAYNPYSEPYLKYSKYLNKENDRPGIHSISASYSNFYGDFIFEKYIVDSCVLVNKKFSVHQCYQYESSHFKGPVREQLITKLFNFKKQHTSEDISGDIENALSYVKNRDFIILLEQIKSNNAKGSPAYNFNLTDENNKTVTLSDFKGRIVILDFWFTGCVACRELAPALLKIEKKFEHQNIVFISISVDKSKNTWLSSLQAQQYCSPLSVNLFTGEQGAGHPIVKHYGVNSFPTLILIDKNGKLGTNPPNPLTDKGDGFETLIKIYQNK